MEAIIWETKEELVRKLAQRVRNIRKRCSISQQKLAAINGVSYGSIKRFKSTGQISLLSLTKIATALGMAEELRQLFTQVQYRNIEEVIKSLDDMLIAGISAIDGIHTTVDAAKRLPGIVSLVVDKSDFHNERFIKKISEDIALSTGSACSAGEPSYVIQALGLANEVTKVLRVSINKYTTEDDINSFLSLLKTI